MKIAKVEIKHPNTPLETHYGRVVGETSTMVQVYMDDDRLANRPANRAEWFARTSRVVNTTITETK